MARGLQSGLDDPWLYVDLDTFPARLPPYRPDAQVLQRMVARDYENIDQDCCDVLLDTDALSIDEQVSAVRRS